MVFGLAYKFQLIRDSYSISASVYNDGMCAMLNPFQVPFMTSTSVSSESKKLKAKSNKGGFFDDLVEDGSGDEASRLYDCHYCLLTDSKIVLTFSHCSGGVV